MDIRTAAKKTEVGVGIRWINHGDILDLRLDPTVLSNWIIHLVFVVAITHGIATHVSAELEWIITILEFVSKAMLKRTAVSASDL
jgi:hypothetical protein